MGVVVVGCEATRPEPVVLAPTDWSALADQTYTWLDPAHLSDLRSWVNAEPPFEGAEWDAAPPSEWDRAYPLAERGADGAWRPVGPRFYPQEDWAHGIEPWTVPGREDPVRVWVPTGPLDGNWIDDPGRFTGGPHAGADPALAGLYLVSPVWDGETWAFVSATHLYSAFQQEHDRGFPDPSQLLDEGDRAVYAAYARKRDRLEVLRERYFATLEAAFDPWDRDRLLAALREAGPGAEVRLGPGDFYLERPLTNGRYADTTIWPPPFTPEWAFSGAALRGAGRDETVLHMLPGALFDGDDDIPRYLILAPDGSQADSATGVTIAGLSLEMAEPTRLWVQHGAPANILAQGLGLDAGGRDLAALLDGVAVRGTFDDRFYALPAWSGRSTLYGMGVEGVRGGSIEIRGAEVARTGIPIFVRDAVDTRSTVGGTPEQGCLLRENVAGIDPEELKGGELVVSHNRTDDSTLVWMVFTEAGPTTTYRFEHNDVHWSGSRDFSAIEIWGTSGFVPDLHIVGNRIDQPAQVPPFGPIFVAQGDGVEVADNVIRGSGAAAIWLAPLGGASSHGTVRGNDLSGFEATGAGVVLGPGATGYTVQGTPGTTVAVVEGPDRPPDAKAHTITGAEVLASEAARPIVDGL